MEGGIKIRGKIRNSEDIITLGLTASPRLNIRDGDTKADFPRSDVEDLGRGARFIPGEVTLQRREGVSVDFVRKCSQCCWYWEFVDEKNELVRIYHWDPYTYENIGRMNGRTMIHEKYRRIFYDAGNKQCEDGAGPCPWCGNKNVYGGRVVIATSQERKKTASETLADKVWF